MTRVIDNTIENVSNNKQITNMKGIIDLLMREQCNNATISTRTLQQSIDKGDL